MISETDRAYIAGLFDGEGSITYKQYMRQRKHQKKLVNVYDFVHFDGPHTTEKVLEEVMFFAPRSRIGTRFVFDDMKTYEMDKIAYVLTNFGFFTKEMGDDKCMLEKTE